jgi:hypothetical protein
MQWPASDVARIAAYLAREPAPEERIEYGLAQLTSSFVNANRARNSPARKVVDFLPFHNAWKGPVLTETGSRYSALDLEIMAAMK